MLQMLKLPDGTVKVLVEGVQRARVVSVTDEKTHYVAEAVPIPADAIESTEVEAMRRAMLTQFDQYVKLNKKIPPEILTSLSGIDEPGRLADTVAAHLPLKLDQKQAVLEMFEVKKRLEHLLSLMEAELDLQDVEFRLHQRQEVLKALLDLEHFQHGLFLIELQRKMGGNGIGKPTRLVDARQGGQDFRRDLLIEFHVLVELREHGPAHGFDFGGFDRVRRDQYRYREVMRLLIRDRNHARTLHALDQHLYGAIG